MTTRNKFSPEVRERAVRMVEDHRGDYASERAAISSIAAKMGCTYESRVNFDRVTHKKSLICGECGLTILTE